MGHKLPPPYLLTLVRHSFAFRCRRFRCIVRYNARCRRVGPRAALYSIVICAIFPSVGVPGAGACRGGVAHIRAEGHATGQGPCSATRVVGDGAGSCPQYCERASCSRRLLSELAARMRHFCTLLLYKPSWLTFVKPSCVERTRCCSLARAVQVCVAPFGRDP